MKKLIFTLLFLFFTFYLFSQVNVLYNDTINTITNDIEKYDDNNYFFATYTKILGYYSKSKIKHIDKDGNFIKEKILINANTEIQTAAHNCLIIKDNNIYILNNETYYGDTTMKLVNTIIKTKDNGFAFAGIINKDNYNNCILLKTDSAGNLLWNKEFGYTNVYDKITDIIQTQDNGYILSGSSEKYSTSDWYIVRTDSLGNQIWDWVLHNPLNLNDGAIADLIQTQDGNFVAVGGQTYANYNAYTFVNARLLKFNINKNILIDTLYYEKYENDGIPYSTRSFFLKIKEKQNGDFLVINDHQSKPGSDAQSTSNLYILDNNFNLKSKREFRAFSNIVGLSSYVKDFIIENDGSIAMIGDINSYGFTTPSQQVWFVKTDTNYCDDFGSCDTIKDVVIYPPDTIYKTDTVNINYEIKSIYDIDYNVNITYFNNTLYRIKTETKYNIQANTINDFTLSYQNLVDSSLYGFNVSDTIYIYFELIASDSSIASFRTNIKDNFVVFVEPNGINEIQRQETSLVIYPNPAKDNVQITMNNLQLSKNTSVFVYDVFGHIVIASEAWQSVQTDSHEQSSRYDVLTINIADLEKGIYFVRVGSAVGKFVKK